MSWDDPIAGGSNGTLIRQSLQSYGFVSGSTGWQVTRLGNAEFNNAIFRGEVDINGTNNSYMKLINFVGDPGIQFYPGDFATPSFNFGTVGGIFAQKSPNSAPHNGQLILFPPGYNNHGNFILTGDSAEGGQPTSAELNFDQVIKNGVDLGGGLVNSADANVSSAAIGAAETTVLPLPSFRYKAGRAYKIEFTGLATVSVAPNMPTFRTRKTNPAGQRFSNGSTSYATTSPTTADFRSMFTVGAVDVTAVLVLTLQGSGAFNATMFASTTTTTSLDVYDIGLASAHPNIPVLV
jgi:hypothetical protein